MPIDSLFVCAGLTVASAAALIMFMTLWDEAHAPEPLCENCDCEGGCVATRWCDGCDMWLCDGCWLEHNQDAPCHCAS